MIRTIAEHLSRGVILSRHLPAEFGGSKILVSPEVGLRYWRPGLAKIDPFLFSTARKLIHPGDVVWDVGANIGLFAFSAAASAQCSGRVLAIEPDTWLVGLMRRSSRMQSAASAPVDILPAAVSERVGVEQLHVAKRARAANFLQGAGTAESGGSRESQMVPTVTLDSLLDCYPGPQLLKIDVEGAEVRVLKGALRLLGTVRPAMICEVSAGSIQAVSEILESSGYAVCEDDRVSPDQTLWNIVAKPHALS
jgi:FkbM family methyltransferase